MERATFRHVVGGVVREEASHDYTMRMWTYDDFLRLTRASGFVVRSVFLHEDERARPKVPLGRDAENDGQNRYYVLVPA